MCEVTRQNFESKYEEIVASLQKASFISIDCEFTGLSDGVTKCSLFDTAKARFIKLQESLKNFLIIQIGLSTFKFDSEKNTFFVSSYTFYLMPTSFSINSAFKCQVKSIEFLCKHNFDFNKLFYDGISYLNKTNEAEFLRLIEEGNFLNADTIGDIQKYCSVIAKWSNDVECGSEMLLELNERETFVYLLHQEIRRLPNIWTFFREPNVVGIRKMKESERRDLLLNRKEEYDVKKRLFDSILGFSRIMKEIEVLKKPIVGHNFLPDLMMIYKQFYNPSQVSYEEFKKNITSIFPHVYDTKRMSFALKDMLSKDQTWSSNSLSDLYYYLKTGKGAKIGFYSPLVSHRNEEYLEEKDFHDAGFDSYCTGFCFLKMAHMFSLRDKSKISIIVGKPIYNSWFISATKFLKNQVNLARAQVKYISLDKQDPQGTRPSLLFITSKSNEPLNFVEVLEAAGLHSSLDIQILGKNSALMATTNEKQFYKILDSYRDHKEIVVSKYNFLKHSTSGKMIVSTTIIATVILITLGTSKVWHKGFFLNFPR